MSFLTTKDAKMHEEKNKKYILFFMTSAPFAAIN